jgi:GT2 family glycosyltransferase
MISIIIPTYGRHDLLDKCVKSIQDNCFFDGEIIVVEDGYGLNLYERRKYNYQLIINYANLGFGASVNEGIRQAHYNPIVIINSDVFILKNCIEHMVQQLDHANIVGAKLLYPDGTIQHAGIGYNGNYSFNHHTSEQPSRYVPITGALWVTSKKFMEHMGGFDEHFFMAYEDVDLCFRAIMQGFNVFYDSHATAVHLEGATRGRTIEEKLKINPIAFEKEKEGMEFFKTRYTEDEIIELVKPKEYNG